ncbi:MAG TPA: copper amine oxidase N-terminal domain-containing protein [Armatimonadota bacterium]|nr:copper amine oxidase N-terminal domain-containing protein [Armatimonadota bacterium]HQK94728.1 copper amine oxidase N-terminal domain-containing protein [Armatimonadota bacterium]
MLRSALVLAMAFVVCVGAGPGSAAAITVVVDGKVIKTPAAPFERNQTVYVPISPVAKALGWKVEYNAEGKRVVLCKGSVCKSIKVGPGKNDAVTVKGSTFAPYGTLGKVLNAQAAYNSKAARVTFESTA